MKSDKTLISIVISTLILIIATGAICAHFKTHQNIGKPGVLLEAGNMLNENNEIVRTNRVALPLQLEGLKATPLPITNVELQTLPDDTLFGKVFYSDEAAQAAGTLTVVLMEHDRTSIHRPQYCLPANGFTIDSEQTVELPITLADATPLKAKLIRGKRDILLKDGSKTTLSGIYFYYFATDNKTTSNHSEMMRSMIKAQLLHGETERWGYVSLLTICRPEQEEATIQWAQQLLQKTIPKIQPFANREQSTLRNQEP